MKHEHHHSQKHKKSMVNRLPKAIGHLEHVKSMIEDDEDCTDVLIQLSAVRSALTSAGKVIINEHIDHCICHAIEDGDTESLTQFRKAIERFL